MENTITYRDFASSMDTMDCGVCSILASPETIKK